jgi:hypothetical protein
MPNTILLLVVLTWLRQPQEYFYEIGDNKKSGDWNAHGKYIVPLKPGMCQKTFL